jgi:hypothetical protein
MIDDGEPFDWSRVRVSTARKAHRCTECGRDIAPGERYENHVVKQEGCVDTYKTCRHCMAARKWLVRVCRGYVMGMVLEDLAEHIDAGYNPRWLNLAVSGMRNKWRARDGSLRREMSLPKNLPGEEAPAP